MTGETQNPDDDAPLQRKRTRWTDLLQLGLIVFFVAAFFANEAGSSGGLFRSSYFASALFLSLAASIALYYFLETVAKIERKGWSMAGAGAVFVIILGIAIQVMDGDVTQKLEEVTAERNAVTAERDAFRDEAKQAQKLSASLDIASEQITQLNDTVASLTQSLNEARRRVEIDGRVINGTRGAVRVGVFFDGVVYSGEDQELRFRVSDVPVNKVYRVFIYDQSSNRYTETNRIVDDIEGLRKVGVFNVDASVR